MVYGHEEEWMWTASGISRMDALIQNLLKCAFFPWISQRLFLLESVIKDIHGFEWRRTGPYIPLIFITPPLIYGMPPPFIELWKEHPKWITDLPTSTRSPLALADSVVVSDDKAVPLRDGLSQPQGRTCVSSPSLFLSLPVFILSKPGLSGDAQNFTFDFSGISSTKHTQL